MTTDPIIEPDTKNWTWVLERPCPECGFRSEAVDVSATGAVVRRLGTAWVAALGRADVQVRAEPGKWSVLEYGCHVRDVFELFDYRLAMMLEHDAPQFANWDQDATAIEKRYGEQDPTPVAVALQGYADQLAERFDTVSGEQWARTGQRSDGAWFTVESFARYLVHDPIHHLWDIDAPWP